MWRSLLIGVLVVSGAAGVPAVAHAGSPDDTAPDDSVPDSSVPDTSEGTDEDLSGDVGVVTGGNTGADTTPVTLPVVPVPAGCTAPPIPHIVFVGTVEERDFRTVRFDIEQIRAGRSEPFAAGTLVDIRYGLDAQYLDDDERYLVSAVVDPDLGLLVSRVTDPIEDFGGDEVIGVSETDIDCPEFENPARTLHLDGTPIEAGVLDPFFSARVRILGALLIPFGVALAMIFALAGLRLSISGAYRSISGAGRR
jgi:hypothetical protein